MHALPCTPPTSTRAWTATAHPRRARRPDDVQQHSVQAVERPTSRTWSRAGDVGHATKRRAATPSSTSDPDDPSEQDNKAHGSDTSGPLEGRGVCLTYVRAGFCEGYLGHGGVPPRGRRNVGRNCWLMHCPQQCSVYQDVAMTRPNADTKTYWARSECDNNNSSVGGGPKLLNPSLRFSQMFKRRRTEQCHSRGA